MNGKDARAEFRASLDALINKTLYLPRFKGQTQAVRELRRIQTRSYLR
jgi:hypothetical protein